VDDVVAAVRDGKPVLLPTDTVYGLCAEPYRESSIRRVYELKGRDELQPIALVAAALDTLLELVPELRGRGATIAGALLPGPYTLVLPNPAQRFRWLTGARPDTIGIRVVEPPTGEAHRVLAAVGAVAATSANATGGRDPRRLVDVPDEIRRGCAAELDAGELPGTPSTVLDVTTEEPRVLREGAVGEADALAAVGAALSAY
jgi:L-threonylcarbamoyladenylate synthase